jgi:hypothetical protein
VGYVMVPVPEENVEDVMRFVVRLMTQASIEPWTEVAVAEIFDEVDEITRVLLSAVAKATLGGAPLTEPDAVRAIQLDWRETMGIVRELNEAAGEDAHAPLVLRKTISETLPNGRTRDVRVLTMEGEVANFVSAADRAQLQADGHLPGPTSDGG